MPKRDRNHGRALAALAIIVLGVVLVTMFGALEQAQRKACEQPAYGCDTGGNDQPHNGWRDTNAQWAMAVFAALGIGVGAWTIILLQRTINATKRGNRDARKSAERQLRAYVFPAEAFIHGIQNAERPTVYIGFTNSGQTPFYNATLWLRFGAYGPHGPFEQGNRIPRPVANTGPGLSFHRSFKMHQVSLEDVFEDARTQKGWNVYLFGSIRYQDAFKRWRHTDFRLQLEDVPTRNSRADRVDFGFCDGGNDSD